MPYCTVPVHFPTCFPKRLFSEINLSCSRKAPYRSPSHGWQIDAPSLGERRRRSVGSYSAAEKAPDPRSCVAACG